MRRRRKKKSSPTPRWNARFAAWGSDASSGPARAASRRWVNCRTGRGWIERPEKRSTASASPTRTLAIDGSSRMTERSSNRKGAWSNGANAIANKAAATRTNPIRQASATERPPPDFPEEAASIRLWKMCGVVTALLRPLFLRGRKGRKRKASPLVPKRIPLRPLRPPAGGVAAEGGNLRAVTPSSVAHAFPRAQARKSVGGAWALRPRATAGFGRPQRERRGGRWRQRRFKRSSTGTSASK